MALSKKEVRVNRQAEPAGTAPLPGIVTALGEEPVFRPGDAVRILTRNPIGHYRVPAYLRGKTGTVEAVIEPAPSPSVANALWTTDGTVERLGGAKTVARPAWPCPRFPSASPRPRHRGPARPFPEARPCNSRPAPPA